MKSPAELEAISLQYAAARGIEIDLQNPLGAGTDGSVWPTNRGSAIKVLELEKNYLQELRCYQRLMENNVERVDGLAVPQLIDYDDTLLVIEMEIVRPPYLLDFGKAYLDESSPYSNEELSRHLTELAAHFSQADLPRIKKILRLLRNYGIEYLDAKAKNIRLRSDEDERLIQDDDWDKEPPTDYSGDDVEGTAEE
jgi:hypothetical protein